LLAENLGQMPVLGGNSAEIIVDYDAVLDRLVADIDRAEHHVHLLFYIFADDSATAPVIAALARASRRGVRCRVLIDSVGSRSALSTLIPKLTASGVAVREMLPVGLFRWGSARLDLRNHRKIAVIDGRAAYTGSQNLVAAGFKDGITYEDLMLHVTGPAVWDLQYITSEHRRRHRTDRHEQHGHPLVHAQRRARAGHLRSRCDRHVARRTGALFRALLLVDARAMEAELVREEAGSAPCPVVQPAPMNAPTFRGPVSMVALRRTGGSRDRYGVPRTPEGAVEIKHAHIAKAVGYRLFDRSVWK
jgi:phosphatidylserine/phosphatidylglycerophosphate/cardiolipin synthase-like enzyme